MFEYMIYIYMYIYIHIYIFKYIHIYEYRYIYICINTYIYLHIDVYVQHLSWRIQILRARNAQDKLYWGVTSKKLIDVQAGIR